MSFGIICGQEGCRNYAAYRYTWPGRDEAALCTEHVNTLRATADAIGLHLQVVPLTDVEHNNLRHPLAASPASAPKEDERGK